MKIQNKSKIKKCLELAKQAEMLSELSFSERAETMSVSEKKIAKAIKLREEIVADLVEKQKQLKEKKESMQYEHYRLAKDFCKQNKKHTYTYRTERISSEPLYRTFRGNVYPEKSYRTCLVCDYTDDPEVWRYRYKYYKSDKGYDFCYKNGSEKVIKEAAEQTENLELQKTARSILKIEEEIENIDNKLYEIKEVCKRTCDLLGHDENLLSDNLVEFAGGSIDDYRCKCCGMRITYHIPFHIRF